jgi:hypothetical protein
MTTTLMTSLVPIGRALAGMFAPGPRRAALAIALTSTVIAAPAFAQNVDDKKAAERGTSTGSSVEPPAEKWDQSDVEEKPGKQYLFIGAHYRGNVVPQFMINLFVDEGKTIYTNAGGIELDLRKDGFSLIPALTFQELNTGDILFKEKDTKDIAQNYSMVNSSLYVLYARADLLWSPAKISKNVEFEAGVGLGVGTVFGHLVNNWVREDPNGSLEGENGKHYTPCETAQNPANGNGCNKVEHKNSDVDKVGRYHEKDWFQGGAQPVFFPWITPQIGLRFKPIKQFVARLGIGFGLTGFWFGLSGQYGLEQKPRE